MKVNELITTCINQWNNKTWDQNTNFKILLLFEDKKVELDYKYADSKEYLTKYRDLKVSFWKILDKDILIIGIKE